MPPRIQADYNHTSRVNRKHLPKPTLSLLESMDIKHKYLVQKLKNLQIPDTSEKYCYVDSEFRSAGRGHNDCANVDEWSCLEFDDEGEPSLLTLKSKDYSPTPTELTAWADTLGKRPTPRLRTTPTNCFTPTASAHLLPNRRSYPFQVLTGSGLTPASAAAICMPRNRP